MYYLAVELHGSCLVHLFETLEYSNKVFLCNRTFIFSPECNYDNILLYLDRWQYMVDIGSYRVSLWTTRSKQTEQAKKALNIPVQIHRLKYSAVTTPN